MDKNKRSLILDEARKQFYENGYLASSLEMIARRCGIQKQAISYYFGSKEKLAQEVYTNIIRDQNFVIRSKARTELGVTDEKILNAISILFVPRWYREDDNVMRFFSEFNFNYMMDVKNLKNDGLKNFNMMSSYVDEENSDMQQLYMAYIAMCYASNGALLHFCHNEFFLSLDTFTKYHFSLRFIPFIKDPDKLDAFYNEVNDVYKKMNFTIRPYFVIE